MISGDRSGASPKPTSRAAILLRKGLKHRHQALESELVMYNQALEGPRKSVPRHKSASIGRRARRKALPVQPPRKERTSDEQYRLQLDNCLAFPIRLTMTGNRRSVMALACPDVILPLVAHLRTYLQLQASTLSWVS